ncbi:MAG: universal stress protein [Pseudomonadota bacterium]
MNKILACVDGSVYADSVADHAAWAASRLGLPVELMQVLGRREARSSDRSGRIVAGARRKLLEELAELDAERARLQQSEARLGLDEARARIIAGGLSEVTTVLRQGDLLEALADREAEAAFTVVGKRGEAADFATLHLGSNLERIVRASHAPVLIAARAFRPIARALIAFDGSPSALKAVDEVSRSPLHAGIACLVLMVGAPGQSSEAALERAGGQLVAAGIEVETRLTQGQPEEVIGAAAAEQAIDLLVMGAYGHSRLRSLVIGSTTSALIRACKVPVAIYR